MAATQNNTDQLLASLQAKLDAVTAGQTKVQADFATFAGDVNNAIGLLKSQPATLTADQQSAFAKLSSTADSILAQVQAMDTTVTIADKAVSPPAPPPA